MSPALALLKENAFYVGLIGLVAIGFLVLRTTPTDLASMDELDALLTSGKPTLIEFFSNT
jgi:hypothetical protein